MKSANVRSGNVVSILVTMTLGFGLAIGVVFGLLAGACAFVIAYHEYKSNWAFHGNAVTAALQTAFTTFLLFFVAGLCLPWVFRTLLSRG